MKKLSIEEVKLRLKNNNGIEYPFVEDEYDDQNSKITAICNKGHLYSIRFYHATKGVGCRVCAGNEKLKVDDILQRSKVIHGDKFIFPYIDSEYENNRSLVTFVCKDCGYEGKKSVGNLLSKYKKGCPKCSNNLRYDVDELKYKMKNIHRGYEYPYIESEYLNTRSSITIVCTKDHVFKQRVINHLLLEQGCPICQESKGERKIRNYLIENGIDFIRQKKFKDCKYISHLPFDFYLPKFNMCIEFDGEQHFKPIRFNGISNDDAIKELEKTQLKDEIKTNYCLKNDIKMIRIKYNDDIIKILKNNIYINESKKEK